MSLSAHEELLMLRKRARRRLIGAIVLVGFAVLVLWNVLEKLPQQEMKPQSVEITGLPASAETPVAPPVVASAPEPDILAVLPPEDAIIPPADTSQSVPAAPVAAVAGAVPMPVAPQVSNPPVTVTSPGATAVPAVVPPAPAKPVSKPEPKPEVKPEPKPVAKPEPVKPPVAEKKPELARKPDPMAILEGRDTVEPPAAPKASNTTGSFNVQLAALSDPEKVSSLRQRLSAIGVSASFSKVQTSKGEVTRVRVGPFASREQADATLRKLERAGVTGIIVNR